MRNSRGVPLSALLAATALGVLLGASRLMRGNTAAPLSELEIGLAAWAFAMGVFGAQGLISIALEGSELRLGVTAPRLTGPLTWAIVGLSAALLGIALLLGTAILAGQPVAVVGVAAGAGCLILALLLVAYKEAFVGDEARLDARKDGIPW
ncbi:MAG: hypothetical protein NVSMB2_11000 [Chloroflexota bacterium]